MKFVEYKDLSKNRIRELGNRQVRIQDTWYPLPCAIAAQQIVTNDQLSIQADLTCFEQLLHQQPADLIMIGHSNNSDIRFDADWHRLLVRMNQQGIGLEQMSADAAVRTFNVLMTEERPFWLVLT